MSDSDFFAAPAAAVPPQSDGVVDFAEAEKTYPDHEVLKLLYELPAKGMPQGFKCLLKVPRAKIAEVVAKRGHPPFWRHGELVRIKRGDDGRTPLP